ncbi:hypothetical protein OKA04_00515 [Luteolibacter flavescens]|uniref:Uncharacterized protein n=1 Tax=Luteolibacter flavescens TaxID=1859460 RepID=A0ABT3FI44_9BACT|nr:hypothetical protein [Luteolibacter flavescens]MCW1883190.1 hypothetical protein [Luteolibacter flavescens]
MVHRVRFVAAISAVLCATSALGSDTATVPLLEPLEEVAKKQQGKSVLVIFTARWDASDVMLRKLMEDETVKAVLHSHEVAFYMADCTVGAGAGATEMRRHGIKATPISALVRRPDGAIGIKRLVLTSVDTFVASLRSLLEKGEKALPDAKDKAPK